MLGLKLNHVSERGPWNAVVLDNKCQGNRHVVNFKDFLRNLRAWFPQTGHFRAHRRYDMIHMLCRFALKMWLWFFTTAIVFFSGSNDPRRASCHPDSDQKPAYRMQRGNSLPLALSGYPTSPAQNNNNTTAVSSIGRSRYIAVIYNTVFHPIRQHRSCSDARFRTRKRHNISMG